MNHYTNVKKSVAQVRLGRSLALPSPIARSALDRGEASPLFLVKGHSP